MPEHPQPITPAKIGPPITLPLVPSAHKQRTWPSNWHLSGNPLLYRSLVYAPGAGFFERLQECKTQLTAQTDRLALQSGLDRGLEVSRQYAENHDFLLSAWFQHVVTSFKGTIIGDVTLAATGRYGAGVLPKLADVDITVLFRDGATDDRDPVNRKFVDHLLRLYGELREVIPGLDSSLIINNLRDTAITDPQAPGYFSHEKLCSMLDARVLAGSVALAEELRQSLRGISHHRLREGLLAKMTDYEDWVRKYPAPLDHAGDYNLKYGVGGLRRLDAALWTRCLGPFTPTNDMWVQLPPEVKEGYSVILALRNWLGLQRQKIHYTSHAKDTMSADDFRRLESDFPGHGLTRFLSARRAIEAYFNRVMSDCLVPGILVAPGILYGRHGLCLSPEAALIFNSVPSHRFFALMQAKQQRGLSLDPAAKQLIEEHADTRIQAHPLFLEMLRERGGIPDVLKDLMRLNLLTVVLPDWDDLMQRLYPAGHRSYGHTQASRALERIDNLEVFNQAPDVQDSFYQTAEYKHFREVYERLTPEMILALHIHLLCVDLPITQGRADVEKYVDKLAALYPTLPHATRDLVCHLMSHKFWLDRLVEETAFDSTECARHCKAGCIDQATLDTLTISTLASLDFGRRFNDPTLARRPPEHWQRLMTLHMRTSEIFAREGQLEASASGPHYLKTAAFHCRQIQGQRHALEGAIGGDPDLRELWSAFPEDLRGSPRGLALAKELLTKLEKVWQDKQPLASCRVSPTEGRGVVRVLFPDYPGALTNILSVLSKRRFELRIAEVFTLNEPRPIAMDFFYINLPSGVSNPERDAARVCAELTRVLAAREVGHFAYDTRALAEMRKLPFDAQLVHQSESSPYCLSITMPDNTDFLRAAASILFRTIGAEIRDYSNRVRAMQGMRLNTLRFVSTAPEAAVMAIAKDHFGIEAIRREV